MADRSVEIEIKDLSTLRNLYKSNGSKTYIAFTTIENYMRWFEQDTNVKHIQFFCLNGDFSDGTFVVTDRCSGYASAFADTLNESDDNLIRLLQLIDYSNRYVFLSIRDVIAPVVMAALKKVNVEIVKDMATLLYHLPKEDALQFDVQPPEGIDLRPVTEIRDLEKANSVWPQRSPDSFSFFERMAKYNPNVGAYKKDGTLVAWIFRFPTGLQAALQTDEEHYGHGYGSLVTKAVSKKIAELGHDIYAGIFQNNTPSRTLFGKLGFKSIGEVHWIITNVTCSSEDEFLAYAL